MYGIIFVLGSIENFIYNSNLYSLLFCAGVMYGIIFVLGFLENFIYNSNFYNYAVPGSVLVLCTA